MTFTVVPNYLLGTIKGIQVMQWRNKEKDFFMLFEILM